MPLDPEFKDAIEREDLEKVKKLMDEGADPNAQGNEDGLTPLNYAIAMHHCSVVIAMVEHHRFQYTHNTSQAVLYAIMYSHPELLPHILRKKTSNEYPMDKWVHKETTACWLAEERGFHDAVELLVKHGAVRKPKTLDFNTVQVEPQKIGSGAYGNVILAKWEGKKVAVKYFKNKKTWREELMIISTLNHPNIVTFHGILEVVLSQAFVMEYMDNRDLQVYLQENPRKTEADFHTVYRILWQIAQAMCYLHDNKTVHVDVRAPNILLDNQMRAKLCDFNCAQKLPPNSDVIVFGEKDITRLLTLAYDILCFGTVLNMVSTEKLFGQFYIPHPIDKLGLIRDTAGTSMPSVPPGTPTSVVSLIQWCTHANPSERPSATQVVKEMAGIVSLRLE